jgi:hypothetical protein
MTVPLIVLAAGTVLLGILERPAWPWFTVHSVVHAAHVQAVHLGVVRPYAALDGFGGPGDHMPVCALRSIQIARAEAPDALETLQPDIFTVLRNKFWMMISTTNRSFASTAVSVGPRTGLMR